MGILDSLKQQAASAVESITTAVKNLGNTLEPSKVKGQNSSLPWANTNKKEVFFTPLEIDGSRWDKIYPYRLVVIDTAKGNQVVGAASKAVVDIARLQQDSATISVTFNNFWEYKLPITPQQLSYTNEYAITVTPTLRGVLEEHGGLKFKFITLSGTFGVWPSRPSYTQPVQDNSIKSNITEAFRGTLNAAARLVTSVKNTINTFTGNNPKPKVIEPQPYEVGYYHALYLDQFLEQYAIAKKDPANKSWRLVLDMPKDNVSYVVTPQRMSINKTAAKPLEPLFQLQLQAWKRIKINKGVDKTEGSPLPKLDSNTFKNILNGIRQSRMVVQNSLDLIKAVRSDFLVPLNALREASLFVKDLAGIPQAISELPRQLTDDFKSAINDSILNVKEGFKNSGSPTQQAIAASLGVSAVILQGQSMKMAGKNNTKLSNSMASDPAYNIYKEPETAFEVFETLEVDGLALTEEQRLKWEEEVERVRAYTVQDLKNVKNTIYGLALDLSNQFGANDSTINTLLNRPTPKTRLTAMTQEENDILLALYETILQMDVLTSTRELDETRKLNPMQYTYDLTKDNNVTFDLSVSKVLVPVPFKMSLEQIAYRYLGDYSRWLEIAALNALREPYIDEEGFVYSFLSNGDGRQFIINTNVNLYIGQTVYLYSLNISKFSRKIINIEKIGSSNNYLVSVDGEPNLGDLLFSAGASMQAYLPGTVNSQDHIYIPSNQPSSPEDYATIIPGLPVDSFIGMTKIDLLLDETMDIAINNQGDFRYSSGMTNIIQALKLKFFSEKDSILTDPTFGLGLRAGINKADISSGEVFEEIQTMILADPRFAGIEKMEISIEGPSLIISLSIVLANNLGIVPLTFQGNIA
jgi:hypothetical protein